MSFIERFLRDCRGATAAEYALILAVAGATLAASAFTLGESIAASIDNSAEVFNETGCNNNGQGSGFGNGNGNGGGNGASNGSGNSCT